MSAKKTAAVTFAVGGALLALLGVVTLANAPARVLREGTKAKIGFAIEHGDVHVCQGNEALPAGTSAIRLSVWAFFGTPVHVTVFSGSRVLTSGSRGPDWTGSTVTVPVTPLSHAVSNTTVCTRLGPNSEALYLLGEQAPPTDAATEGGHPLSGRMGIEYLAPGQASWWSSIGQVARRMGLGHPLSGTWVVLLIFVLVAGMCVLTLRAALRELS